nr:uncharacterized protein LOC111511976 [Leptinotarsa decemlineata]
MAQVEKQSEDLTTDALPAPNRSVAKENTNNENVREDNGDDKIPLPDETQCNSAGRSDKENTGVENVNEDGEEKIPQLDDETQFSHTYTSSAGTSRTAFRKINPSSAVYQMVNISYSKGVHIGDNIVHNHNGLETFKKTNIVETAAIKSLKLRSDRLTREDLLFVSTHMDSSWKDVARAMKFSEGEISQFVCDHQHSGIKEVRSFTIIHYL